MKGRQPNWFFALAILILAIPASAFAERAHTSPIWYTP